MIHTFFERKKDCTFLLLVVFLSMPKSGLEESLKGQDFVLYEHDHKYHIDRNPGKYKDFLVPKTKLVFQDLYQFKHKVL